jgi:hypothetical protein
MNGLDEILAGARLVSGLPRFLHGRLSAPAAREVLRRRFEGRGRDFLDLARRAVFDNPRSPYRTLLGAAGCEYGDLERLVTRRGLEEALRALLREGVYLTLDEFKGRRPVVRGSRSVAEAGPAALANPLTRPAWAAQTSGTSGHAAPVTFGLDFVRDRAVNLLLFLEARNGREWRHAVWGVPGTTDLIMLLELAGVGLESLEWFSQVRAGGARLHPRYAWSARLVGWSSRLAGRPLPRPIEAPLDRPLSMARWARDVLDRGLIPHLTTWVTPAVRLGLAAREAGIDLSGLQLTLGGEPLTEARRDLLRASGAVVVPRFLAIETGYIGYGCLDPAASDDNHLIHDFNALIPAGPEGEAAGFSPRAILLTSLRRSAPVILLNVSLGDEADLARRECGCPLGRLGYDRHLSRIRSVERLKSGGMTFLDRDVVPVLEQVLPRLFGGTALDYQLVESEGPDGTPEVVIVAAPSLGPLDEGKVAAAFLEAVGRGSGAERIASLQWQTAGTVRVERRVPETTATGKIRHLLRSRP